MRRRARSDFIPKGKIVFTTSHVTYHVHFISGVISYHEPLHTMDYFILCCIVYASLYIMGRNEVVLPWYEVVDGMIYGS